MIKNEYYKYLLVRPSRRVRGLYPPGGLLRRVQLFRCHAKEPALERLVLGLEGLCPRGDRGDPLLRGEVELIQGVLCRRL